LDTRKIALKTLKTNGYNIKKYFLMRYSGNPVLFDFIDVYNPGNGIVKNGRIAFIR
jgi:hypothetical protein